VNNSKRKKIVIVDDSDVILHSLKDFFENYDFEVKTCYDGLEGIQITAELKPDLIILDLMMPNFDGIKMLQVKNVLNEIKNIPVIVISGNTDRRNVIAATEAGAYKVISKPINDELLKEVVQEIFGNNTFSENKNKQILSESDNKDVRQNLVQYFLDSFPYKRELIQNAIKNKNKEAIKSLFHEIKGAGGTIGYQEITDIGKEIHEKEINSQTDWMFIEYKSNILFRLVQEIKNNQNIV
jgi:DNA-binding response OmpR family regulator